MFFEVSCNAEQYDATPDMADEALERAIANRLRLERMALVNMVEVRDVRGDELRVIRRFMGEPSVE